MSPLRWQHMMHIPPSYANVTMTRRTWIAQFLKMSPPNVGRRKLTSKIKTFYILCNRIHTTNKLPIDFLYDHSSNAMHFLCSAIKQLVVSSWYHFEDWVHTPSTNMKKPCDERSFFFFFFEIQSIEELHALSTHLPISSVAKTSEHQAAANWLFCPRQATSK